MNRLLSITALLALGIFMSGTAVWGVEDLKSVSPEELRNNPKQYWLTGVVFKDVLSALPAGETIRIAEEQFVAFQTLLLGTCYADSRLVADMAGFPLEREYLFRGTVLTRRGDFYVVVRSATASFEKPEEDKTAILDSVSGFQPGTASQADDPLNALLAEAYKACFAYAEETGIDVQQLFNPNPRYEEKLLSLIGEATRTIEREKKTTAPAILSRMVLDILAARYGQGGALSPDTSNDAETAAPGPVQQMNLNRPLSGQLPESDASVFVLQSGVGKRPLPPPPETNAEVVARPDKPVVAPLAPVESQPAVLKTGAVKRATSLWGRQQQTAVQQAPNDAAPHPLVAPASKTLPDGVKTSSPDQPAERQEKN